MIELLRAPPPAPNQNLSESSTESLSSLVTHSIQVTDGNPTMTFASAIQRNLDSTSSSSLLGSEQFVQWNQASPPVPTSTGLFYTPP